MPFDINDLCLNHGWSKSDQNRQLDYGADGGGPAQIATTQARPAINYTVSWDIFDEATFQDFLTFFKHPTTGVRLTRAFDWRTPDDVLVIEKFRFASFRAQFISATLWRVSATLSRAFGVA